MKLISIWQPFATLAVRGYKVFETRTWSPPRSIIGQTIGIAATKLIRPEQRAHFADPQFQRYYKLLGLPDLEDLPRGYLLGTVTLDSAELITEEFLEDVSDEEQQYGWFNLGDYAWRMTNSRALEYPVLVKGAQGFYDWHGRLPGYAKEECSATD